MGGMQCNNITCRHNEVFFISRPYAESVEKRLLAMAIHMRVDMIFLTHDSALPRAIQACFVRFSCPIFHCMHTEVMITFRALGYEIS